TLTIVGGTQLVESVTLQGKAAVAVNGDSLVFPLPSTISNGPLAVAGGTVTANASLGVNTFNLSSGAFNGSGNLTVTNAFSHTGGVFNTTGAVSITQATGNLTLTQPLSAGALTINVPAGGLTVQDALVSSTGAMSIAVSNALNVTAVAAPTELRAGGLQTISANGITVQGAASGSDLSAKISSAAARASWSAPAESR